MTWSIVSRVANRLLGMTRCAGRSAFFSAPHLVLCVLLSFPPIEAFSRRGRCRTREAAQATEYQDQRISRGCRRKGARAVDARGHIRTPCPSVARLELHVTGLVIV